MRLVRVYVGRDCHLCEQALHTIRGAKAEVPFVLEVVDITGEPELERAHRELLPVVEIDGAAAFHYVVPPLAFRARVA